MERKISIKKTPTQWKVKSENVLKSKRMKSRS